MSKLLQNNISFFLTPKQEVAYLLNTYTMRQALEKMEYHRYSSVPVIDHDGKYLGTITEGDLLWKMKGMTGTSINDTNKILLADVPRRFQNKPVNIDVKMEDLVEMAIGQNFVPVVDDNGVFIGIVRRREIIEFCLNIIKGKID